MTQEELEIQQIEKFLRIANIDYSSLTPNPQDPPDLIVTLPSGKLIGIEHTMLPVKNGGKIKAMYSTFDNVIEEALKHYEQLNLPAVHVTIDFKEKMDTRNGKDKALASELCQLIADNIPSTMPVPNGFEVGNSLIPEAKLPYYTSSIEIFRYTKFTRNLWQRPGIVFSGELPNNILTEKIDRKNLGLLTSKSDTRFHEAWLVLIVEGKEWSEFASYLPSDFNLDSNWMFDKIYICGMFGNEIERLK